ncbi:Uncharacterised protein [Mycoplasmopsis citelli]|uniref:Uncharacterized protein n=1 Tax=Mycoplasmopsis citelli TaxID=171281 RepID=A0A449B103_9BACT|nr:hypothetical protein [Mycoplasmopsis citelli]VEU74272.1 Uncharacterised protein [Mycoplasmopsis citelli]
MAIILISIFGFLFFILGAIIAFLILVLYYFRSFSGVILFKIDNINKRVLRFSGKYLFMSTIFDSKRSEFTTYKYISTETFLSFLNQKAAKELSDYLSLSPEFQRDLVIRFDQNKEMINALNLTFFEKQILWLDKLLNYKTVYVLKITAKNDGYFRCSIIWNRNRVYRNEDASQLINNQKKLNNMIQKKVILALALKPYFYVNEIQPLEIISIYKHFGIPYKNSYINIQDGFIYFVFNKKSNSAYLSLLERVKQLNKNFLLTKYFIAGTIFVLEEPYNPKHTNLELLDKIRYSLFNILNNRNQSDQYINLKPGVFLSDEFKDFLFHYNQYIRINNNENFRFTQRKIKVYKSNRDSILSVKEIDFGDFDPKYLKLFQKIPYLNYLFEDSWYQNIKNSLNYQPSKIPISSNMVKISQEVFLKSPIVDSTTSPTYLVYAYKNLFDYKKLRKKIKSNYQFNIPTALYVNQIDKPLINVINYTKLKVIVIGEVISSRLNETNVFYDCINIVSLAQKNGIKIVYENPDLNLDPLIVEKAQIKAYFK